MTMQEDKKRQKRLHFRYKAAFRIAAAGQDSPVGGRHPLRIEELLRIYVGFLDVCTCLCVAVLFTGLSVSHAQSRGRARITIIHHQFRFPRPRQRASAYNVQSLLNSTGLGRGGSREQSTLGKEAQLRSLPTFTLVLTGQ